MERLLTILGSEFCSDLAAALLHTLWQGALAAAVLYLFLKSGRATNANARYAACVITLGAVVLCGFISWAVLDYEPARVSESGKASPVIETAKQRSLDAGPVQERTVVREWGQRACTIAERAYSLNWQGYAVALWLVGVAVMLYRTASMVAGLQRLRRVCVGLEDERVLGIIEDLRKEMGISRRIRAVVARHIQAPGVIGFVWPTLLLPVSMLSGVPAEDLKAILSHELAHIRRYDYLVNWCQMIVEAVLFFNPAVWWISRQIRIEREACCDMVVVAATGQRVRYAQMLAEWAQRLGYAGAPAAGAAAIGFADKDNGGGLVERVKRILVVGHKPCAKMSWYVTLAMMVVSAAALVGLWSGVNVGVRLARKWLTPEQRIEKMQEIRETHGQPDEDKEYGPEDKLTITGIVKTWDGRPLSQYGHVRIRSQRPRNCETSSIAIKGDGVFQGKVEYGTVWLSAQAEGYAPEFAGPFKAEPGGVIDAGELVLENGFPARISVVDEQGKPVEAATLTGGFKFEEVSSYGLSLTTDYGGTVLIDHCSDKELSLELKAEGIESERRENIKLAEGVTYLWEAKRARATSGVVVSEQTGETVEGAKLYLLYRLGGNASIGFGEPTDRNLVAATDEEGKFSIRTLRSDSKYLIFASAEGLGYRYLEDVTAGQEDIVVKLPAKPYVRGKITGDLEQLRRKDDLPVISYADFYRYPENNGYMAERKWVNVDIRDGVGYFEITDFWGAELRIYAAKKRVPVTVEEEPVDDLVIELEAESEEPRVQAIREVLLKFEVPRGMPEPRGEVQFEYYEVEYDGMKVSKRKAVAVENGEARIDMPVPNRIGYRAEGVAGYWFEHKWGVKVAEGDETFVIEVPVLPAGAIYGEVLEADGGVARNTMVSVVMAEKSKLMGNGSLGIEVKNSAGGPLDEETRFMAGPLPLGGSYLIVAHRGDSYVVSEPIEIREIEPIKEITLRYVGGVTVSGRIVGPDGQGLASKQFAMGYKLPCHGFGGADRFTDQDGGFTLESVNPDAPGDYEITVQSRRGYQPTRKQMVLDGKPMVVELEKGYVVEGILVDEVGEPVEGVEVYAMPCDYRPGKWGSWLDSEEKTDERGRFRFSNMEQIAYRFGVRGANLDKSSGQIMARGGQAEQVTLRAKRPDSSN